MPLLRLQSDCDSRQCHCRGCNKTVTHRNGIVTTAIKIAIDYIAIVMNDRSNGNRVLTYLGKGGAIARFFES